MEILSIRWNGVVLGRIVVVIVMRGIAGVIYPMRDRDCGRGSAGHNSDGGNQEAKAKRIAHEV
jgi:hypothetical protein